jgi:hypothetical protein
MFAIETEHAAMGLVAVALGGMIAICKMFIRHLQKVDEFHGTQLAQERERNAYLEDQVDKLSKEKMKGFVSAGAHAIAKAMKEQEKR